MEREQMKITLPFLPITIEYDKEQDTLFLWFQKGLEINHSEGRMVDGAIYQNYNLDEQGRQRLVNIEILNISQRSL